MQLDRNLLISMFIVGAMSHFEQAEVQQHKEINNILMKLQKRNFTIKNGTTEDRLWCDAGYVRKQIKRQPKKRDQFNKKGINAIRKGIDRHNSWVAHGKIADKAWMRAAEYFSENNAITVNQLVIALLRKEEGVMKAYKFNKKHLDKFADTGIKGHFIASSRVATKLLECLDEEIAHYNYNADKVA